MGTKSQERGEADVNKTGTDTTGGVKHEWMPYWEIERILKEGIPPEEVGDYQVIDDKVYRCCGCGCGM